MKSLWQTCILLLAAPVAVGSGPGDAGEIVEQSGVRGGVIVHAGCGDGRLTAALRISDSCLVQGLDRDVSAAREHIRPLGLSGPVSAPPWDGGCLQWLAGPRYFRHHDHMSGASAMVTAQGRCFWVFEEAPRASILIPPRGISMPGTHSTAPCCGSGRSTVGTRTCIR